MENEEYDYIFKYALLGEAGVGKSQLLLRFADDVFSDTYSHTIGVDFKNRMVTVENSVIRLQVWDTAGQERFQTITPEFSLRGSHGIILVYDVTNLESFRHVDSWLQEVDRYGGNYDSLILVGNKMDLTSKREVTFEMGKEYAESHGISFMETSAKCSTNVENLFITMTKEIKSKIDSGQFDPTNKNGIVNIRGSSSVNNKNSSSRTICCI